jgi:UDP-glucose 4-epimerase
MTALGGRRTLVTGGAGFVGSRLAGELARAGARVTILDDLSAGHSDGLADAVTLVGGSVTDAELVSELVAEHPLVFHLAARGIIASTRSPREDFDTNIAGTLNVLLAARRHGVERVVYASSASVYGNPRSIPLNEDDHVVPLSPYAVSKLSGEHYCLAFYESYGVPTAVVRYSNVYGPRRRAEDPYSGVVTKFLSSAIARAPLSIHGDGEQTRDFTFIDDAVDATILAATHPRAEGEVFNVGTGIETSVNELVRTIAETLGVDAEVEHVDRREIDNIRRRVVNIEKIRRMLRWSPQFALAAGIRRTAESLVLHQ